MAYELADPNRPRSRVQRIRILRRAIVPGLVAAGLAAFLLPLFLISSLVEDDTSRLEAEMSTAREMSIAAPPTLEGDGHRLSMNIATFTGPYAKLQSTVPAPAPDAGSTAPANLDELYLQLDEAWAANNWEHAIAVLNQIRALIPDDARAREGIFRVHVNYGYHLLAAGNVNGAQAQFDAALAVKPDGQEAMTELRQLASDPSLAQSVTRWLEAELQAARASGDWVKAIRLLRQLQLLNPGRTDLNQQLYDAYIGYGDQLMAEGKAEAAREIYRRAESLRQSLAGGASTTPITTTATPVPAQSGQTVIAAVATLTPTPSASPSPTASFTPTPTGSPTATPTATPSPSPTATPSPSASPTATPSPSASPSPTASFTPTPTGSPTATPTATGSVSPTPPMTPGVKYHIVQRGDTLFSLAQTYGVTVAAIMAANGLHNSTIYVGQVLIIPTTTVVTVTPQIIVYVVRPGDTLFSLARHFGTTVEAIARLNGLRSSTIFVGQQLRIPTV